MSFVKAFNGQCIWSYTATVTAVTNHTGLAPRENTNSFTRTPALDCKIAALPIWQSSSHHKKTVSSRNIFH